MKISEEVGSKYRFIIICGKRVSQLQKGAKPRLENIENQKMTLTAMQELSSDLLVFKKLAAEKRIEPYAAAKARVSAQAAEAAPAKESDGPAEESAE